jgi:hypothetical protein
VRVHRYVCEGRADDADVAGTAVVADMHEPGAALGLHTTRRARSRRRPPRPKPRW